MPEIALTLYQGPAGDRNARGTAGARSVAHALAQRLGVDAAVVGRVTSPQPAGWREELGRAAPALQALATRLDAVFAAGRAPLLAASRCAASIATLPVLAWHRPDACVVWFDAHGDCNTPETSGTGYLGGMVLTAAAGLWDSELGAGLAAANVILVGARDLDPAERQLIEQGVIRLVPAGAGLAQRLSEAIAGRPAYVHLDCDVLEPGLVPTEFSAPAGLSWDELLACSQAIAQGEVVGFEVAEYEDTWPSGGDPVPPGPLLDAIAPMLDALRRGRPAPGPRVPSQAADSKHPQGLPAGYALTFGAHAMDVDAVHAFLTDCYWSRGIPREVVARAIAHSLCIGLFHEGRQVGFARAITDRATFAYLADVYVLEAHRGRGLGRVMTRTLLDHADLQGLRRMLLATRDAHALYRDFGFAALAQPDRMMEVLRPDVYRVTGGDPPAPAGEYRNPLGEK